MNLVGKERFDFAEEWRRAQLLRKAADNREQWNARARTFKRQSGISGYAERFIELCALKPGESVLDMGCGTGALAIPLAKTGHPVVAADFANEMLSCLAESAEEAGLDANSIKLVEASWEDDWEAAGIPRCDVVVASRSIATMDLEACLMKLERWAKRRCCISLAAASSPRFDPILFDAIGMPYGLGGEFTYAMNILWQLGREPELTYIRSEKRDFYADEAEAREHIRAALGDLSDDQEAALERYYDEHLTTYIGEDGVEYWGRDYPLHIDWVFISWEPKR